jgi:hypothetical protein
MPDDSNRTNAETLDDSDALLRGLELEPTADLPGRVRRSIERRYLGRDLAAFYWTAIGSLLLEWLSALLGRVTGRHPPKWEQR